MKLLFILSLLGVVSQSAGDLPEMDSYVENILSLYASEIENCDVGDLDVGSFRDIKNICQSLVNSGVCADIAPEYLVDCNDLISDDNEVELQQSISSSWGGCFSGFTELSGFTSVLLPVASIVNDINEDVEWSAELLDNSRSTWNYYRAEGDRLDEEDSTFSNLSNIAFSDDRERAIEYGCLNKRGRWKVRCDEITGIIIHGTAGLALGAATVVTGTAGGAVVGGGVGSATGVAVGAFSGGLGGAFVTGGLGGSVGAIGGAVVGGVGGFGVWLNSVVAGVKMVPQDAMRGVKKQGSFDKKSSSVNK